MRREDINAEMSGRMFSRREFLRASGTAALAIAAVSAAASAAEGVVQCVLGPASVAKLGFTLPHEHVLCDFIGASETGRHRWNVDAVCARMLPLLQQAKQRGIQTFVDCTPAYIGRDPRILKRLAAESGLHIITNTGYYGAADDKYVPAHAWIETADQLAAAWLREFENGIEGTGVRPGFIKTGIDEVQRGATVLSPMDEKLVRAAARASRQSGLAVTCHTGGGPAALIAAGLFLEEGADPRRLIVAHSDGHGLETNKAIAKLGAFVSFDGISRRPLEGHLALVRGMVDKYADHLLLSHDNGWYWAGQKNGGEVRDFNYLSDTFLPACRKAGLPESVLRQITIQNPARAFALAV